MMTMETDTIGGFDTVEPNCAGCGKPLLLENAWMTDGCPCNHVLGCNSHNETRWRLLMTLQQNQQHELSRFVTLDKLRQEAGITAAMLRDGRAKKLVERSMPDILLDDLRLAWKHAVRAFNYCDNEAMTDTRSALLEIVVKLSQQMEFREAGCHLHKNEQYVPEGHHVVEDADGERLVKNDAR